MLYEHFKQGLNLGGYLSQYQIVTDMSSQEAIAEHFETFIREEDIERIKAWGFDHVRITMDGYLFYDRENQRLQAEPMRVLDRCIGWCVKHQVNAVLDCHDFWGHQYGRMDEPTPLMTDEGIRQDYCQFWERLAEHFRGEYRVQILFELFNEITDATGYRWNQLYKSAITAIRAVDTRRWVLVGSNGVNGVSYLDRLDLLDDPFVFYNFHYYEPNVFTHQRAHFSEEFRTFSRPLAYPGDMSEYLAFLAEHPGYQREHELITPQTRLNDADLMKRLMAYAEKFVEYSGKELYCGEFGVIDSASEDEAVKWLRDFITTCDRLKIGHAMGNYKCLDFELVDESGTVVRPKVLALLQYLNQVK